VALKEVEKYEDNQSSTKCEWMESYPFELTKRIAFCQHMKKSEVFIVTEENTVHVFHTKNFDIFERALKEEQVEMES
jgi:predicted GTPase